MVKAPMAKDSKRKSFSKERPLASFRWWQALQSRLPEYGPKTDQCAFGRNWRTPAFQSLAPEYCSAPENIASSFSIFEKRGHHLELRCRYLFKQSRTGLVS
jgi:hypothetical protein